MQQPHRHVTGVQIIVQPKLKASEGSQPSLRTAFRGLLRLTYFCQRNENLLQGQEVHRGLGQEEDPVVARCQVREPAAVRRQAVLGTEGQEQRPLPGCLQPCLPLQGM